MDLTWDWPCGVAYYGVSRAYQTTGNKQYSGRLIGWADEYIELGLPSWTVNTCAMGHVLITLYEETGNQKYWDIVMSKVDYLQNSALRFGDNVLQHTVSVSNDFPEQAWADTLVYGGIFPAACWKQIARPGHDSGCPESILLAYQISAKP